MNRIFSIALVALAFSVSAQVGPTSITLPATVVAGAATNSTASSAVDAIGSRSVTLLLSGASGSSTNGTTAVFQLTVSADDLTYYTPLNGSYRIGVPFQGTTAVAVATNIDTSWFRYFKIGKMENPSLTATTNYITNLVVKYYYK